MKTTTFTRKQLKNFDKDFLIEIKLKQSEQLEKQTQLIEKLHMDRWW